MTNGNDMVAHIENCADCWLTEDLLNRKQITQEQYEKITFDCFNDSQGE